MKVLKPSSIAACMLFALFACHNRLSDSKAEVHEIRISPVGENENKAIVVDKTVTDTTQPPLQKLQTQRGIKVVQLPCNKSLNDL